jgi:molybdopterin-guanine dinucleotide biosynthesis adapter protein
MPKFVAVVGGKHSGKTTIIQNLIRQLKSRGYRVGAIKEMVRIPTLDTPATETERYTQTGAEVVVAVPRNETVIFLRKRLNLNEVLPFLGGLDFAVLEGFETEKTMPKIIAAKTAEEAAGFSDGLAIAVSGLISESKEETAKTSTLRIPVLSSISQAEKLADIVERKAFAKLPDLPHCSQCGWESCYELAKATVAGDPKAEGCLLTKKGNVAVEVNGARIPLKEFPQQIIRGVLEGMVSSLENVPEIRTLKIELKKE